MLARSWSSESRANACSRRPKPRCARTPTCFPDALRKTLSCTDHRTIKSGIERVNRASEAFAGRRMDRSIKRALAGRKVESL